MCRNIKPLFNFEPHTTNEEIRAASLQFVRKVSGFAKPSARNTDAFDRAVDEITHVVGRLLQELETTAPPRDRSIEAMRARVRSERRFGPGGSSQGVNDADQLNRH